MMAHWLYRLCAVVGASVLLTGAWLLVAWVADLLFPTQGFPRTRRRYRSVR